MLADVLTCAILGIDASLVHVEVDIAAGIPHTATVGSPDNVIRESKDRVRAAIRNSGFEMPPRRITVNLAPANLRKEGAGYDLPIALAMLAANGNDVQGKLGGAVIAGELALDGAVRAIRGVLAITLAARAAHCGRVVVPAANVAEAALVDGIEVLGVTSLAHAVAVLTGTDVPAALPALDRDSAPEPPGADFAEVRGQEHAKRALEVAAAGGHNVLLIGPPGAGKTMMARRITSILPALEIEEALDVTKVHSAAGMLNGGALVSERPFRAPHHSVSAAGIFGGAAGTRPGELALAHRGVLFLDELPEFRRDVLEGMRQPLEERRIHIARAGWRLTYPADAMLVAAMNPCACGFRGDPQHACRCAPPQLARYLDRLSGPLLDRIDLHVDVAPVRYRELATDRAGESSAAIRARVVAARDVQRHRLGSRGIGCNAAMGNRELREHARPEQAGLALLERAMARLGLSARAYTRVLKIARTIADLDGAATVAASHVAQAVQYRSLDR